jgi:hypothetical protein
VFQGGSRRSILRQQKGIHGSEPTQTTYPDHEFMATSPTHVVSLKL